MLAPESQNITLWSVVSLLAGTVISAIVSYLLQRRSFAEARTQKVKDRFDIQKAQAFSLFYKMLKIHSDISQLGASVRECLTRAKAASLDWENWQVVLPLANLFDRVNFSADEMALLLSLDSGLFNDIGPYDNVHNSLLDVFDTYRSKRSSMMEKFGAQMNGGIGVTGLTREQHEWIAPRAFELNGLITSMLERTAHDTLESWKLLERLHALLRSKFGLTSKLERKEPLNAAA